MAALTSSAKAAVMNVFRLVTRHALVRDVLEYGGDVTPGARGGLVSAEQGKGGAIVIEENAAAPAVLVVTILALRSLAAAVHVVSSMTAVAPRFQTLVAYAGLMALRTAKLAVAAAQSKARALAVLERRTPPLAGGVTALAALPETSLVKIVPRMTTVALGRRLRGSLPLAMASSAIHSNVSSDQREPRLAGVIEGR